jgi:hypothetical protein
VQILGSVDSGRVEVVCNECDAKCAKILGSVDFKGT